jgi:hypothetical protein
MDGQKRGIHGGSRGTFSGGSLRKGRSQGPKEQYKEGEICVKEQRGTFS